MRLSVQYVSTCRRSAAVSAAACWAGLGRGALVSAVLVSAVLVSAVLVGAKATVSTTAVESTAKRRCITNLPKPDGELGR
jgi:hypothetical protein